MGAQILPGDASRTPDGGITVELQSWDGTRAVREVHQWASYRDLAVDFWAVKADWVADSDVSRMSPDHPVEEYLDDALLDLVPKALSLVAALVDAAPSPEALAFAGAGWLEDLLTAPEFDEPAVAWVADRVRSSARWRYAACHVWLGDEPASRTATLRTMGARRHDDPPHDRLPEVDFAAD